MGGGVEFAVDDYLGDAGAVAEVDEDDAAEVAAAVDPSHEHGLLPCVGGTEGAAHVGAF